MYFQVAAVNKELGSVAGFVDSEHKVVFGAIGASVGNMDGRGTALGHQNGMWYVDGWIVPNAAVSCPERKNQHFHRRGSR